MKRLYCFDSNGVLCVAVALCRLKVSCFFLPSSRLAVMLRGPLDVEIMVVILFRIKENQIETEKVEATAGRDEQDLAF